MLNTRSALCLGVAAVLFSGQGVAADQGLPLCLVAGPPCSAMSCSTGGDMLTYCSKCGQCVDKGFTSCSFTTAVSTGTASSPDGLPPDNGAGEATGAVDGDENTFWDQVDDAAGPHILQLANPAAFAGYSFTAYETNNYAPKTWSLTCDGIEVDAQSDYDYGSGNSFSICLNAVHSCSIVQLRISAWYGPSPAVRELKLHTITGSTSCSVTTALSTGTASSPGGLPSGNGNGNTGEATSAVDGDEDTYFYPVESTGPHILQLANPAAFAGYSFTAMYSNDYAPKTWSLTCDGIEVDAQSDYDYGSEGRCCSGLDHVFPRNRLRENRFSNCLNALHYCSIVQLRISAWYGPAPAIRELKLHTTMQILTYPITQCPTGYVPILDASGCQQQAEAIGMVWKGSLSGDTNWIDGCFEHSTNNDVYYNNRPDATTGNIGGDRLCERDMSPAAVSEAIYALAEAIRLAAADAEAERRAAAQSGCLPNGTFVTNVGYRVIQSAFKVNDNTFVFGTSEGVYFKMHSVDSSGNPLESRYMRGSVSELSELTVALWESATIGGLYTVENFDYSCHTGPPPPPPLPVCLAGHRVLGEPVCSVLGCSSTVLQQYCPKCGQCVDEDYHTDEPYCQVGMQHDDYGAIGNEYGNATLNGTLTECIQACRDATNPPCVAFSTAAKVPENSVRTCSLKSGGVSSTKNYGIGNIDGTLTTYISSCLDCEAGWTYFEGHCYQRQHSELAWVDAKAMCANLGAYMVVPNTQAENTFVTTTMNQDDWMNFAFCIRGHTYLGFSLTDGQRWQDGSLASETDSWRALTAENVEYNETTSTTDPSKGSVINIRLNGTWFWSNQDPTDNDVETRGNVAGGKCFVCEKPIACAAGWTSFEGHCYQRQDGSFFYDVAKQICENFGSYIAVPNTQAENTFLTSTMNPDGWNNTWLGFDWNETAGLQLPPGPQQWEDGSPFSYTDSSRQLSGAGNIQGAVGPLELRSTQPVLGLQLSGRWSFEQKEQVMGFVCENQGYWDTPTPTPSDVPSLNPTAQPTAMPSDMPSLNPTAQPTDMPSDMPSLNTTAQPTDMPSDMPSLNPAAQPTIQPSLQAVGLQGALEMLLEQVSDVKKQLNEVKQQNAEIKEQNRNITSKLDERKGASTCYNRRPQPIV